MKSSTPSREDKQQLRNDVVCAALRWYAAWKKVTNGEGPDASDGWGPIDMKLYGACRRYKGDQ